MSRKPPQGDTSLSVDSYNPLISMYNVENKLIEIFCHVDDFNKVFIKELQIHQLGDGSRKRIKPSILSESEVMTFLMMQFNHSWTMWPASERKGLTRQVKYH